MEDRVEHLLWLLSQCVSQAPADRIWLRLARLAQLPLSCEEDKKNIARWVHENYHELYLKARDKASDRGWISTVKDLEERLKIPYMKSSN